MNFKEITELIKLVNKSNLTEFKMKQGEFFISIRTKKYGKQKAPQVVASPQQIMPVQAPMPAVQVPAMPAAVNTPPPAVESKGADAPAPAAAEANANLLEIKSPIVGTFYRSPSPEKDAYVKVGDMVEEGQVVCIVEAMKLFNEIESEVSGRIVEVVIDDASPVEYDQVLYLVDPKG
ncbi:MAG: acetyl-CoA carboxylase biotin carboxyl carrier protein [Bacteroidota bacterium]